MNRWPAILGLTLVATLVGSCGPSPEAQKPAPAREMSGPTKEEMYREGHRLARERHYDSAEVVLRRAVTIDSTYVPALRELGMLYFDRAFAARDTVQRRAHLRSSQGFLSRADARGGTDSDLLERLCEIAVALGDARLFAIYAEKNAQRYPFDRQYYNLGLAAFGAGEYQKVIQSQKEAVGKFPRSPFIGGFYRQLGRAYMKIGRDQTAERTFVSGLQAVEDFQREMIRKDRSFRETEEYRRLADDRIGMLLSLRKLHHTYGERDKFEQVEQLLREAGYTNLRED